MTPEHPEPSLVEYRPLSGWAIAALLMGLASAVAVVHPLLWAVPIVGVAIAWVALARLRQAASPMIGRTPALLGMALCVMFGAAAPAHVLSHDFWLKSRAERLGDQFFALLQAGQWESAFHLTLRSTERPQSSHHAPAESSPAGKDAPKAEPRSELEIFLADQPMAKIVGWGRRMVVRHVRTDILPSELLRQEVAVLYDVQSGEPGAKPQSILLYERQIVDPGAEERWAITAITTPPPTNGR